MSGLALGRTMKLVIKPDLRLKLLRVMRIAIAEVLEVVESDLEEWLEWRIRCDDLCRRGTRSRSWRNPDFEKWLGFRTDSITKPDSLQSVLLGRLRSSGLTDRQQHIGEAVVANIGNTGYLNTSCNDIAKELSVDEAEVEVVLIHVQSFEPAGVGARSIQECLLLQIARGKYRDSDELCILVDEHLEALGDRNLELIAESMDTTVEHVEELWDILWTLEPKPGQEYGDHGVSVLVPDVIVEDGPADFDSLHVDTGFVVRLADEDDTNLASNSGNSTLLTRSSSPAQLIAEAKYYKNLIELRRQIILGVAKAIVDRQPEFVNGGLQALKPMNRKDIASDLGVTHSTVSRATRNHYMETPCGTFEMSKLFVRGIQTTSGESVPISFVKNRISTLIDQERNNESSPLSDEALAKRLNHEGILISRRTVTKYRQEMEISSSQRR